jgi:hypothetical protein
MSQVWDQSRIQAYIVEGIEENLMLDYKAAASLAKADLKKAEITKDVSAMANSAGGIIIYGIGEDATNRHLPGDIDPIDRNQFSKEWLEQIISNIRPKIDGIVIHPISVSTSPNHVVYVVEIPQSHTAHQATDKRYYKRFNFESVAMEDYEIRDVMGRLQYAKIEVDFRILLRQERETSFLGSHDFLRGSQKERKIISIVELYVKVSNVGKVLGQYVEVVLDVPLDFLYDDYADFRELADKPQRQINLDERTEYFLDNTVRDYIKGGGIPGSPEEYGPARYVPILPGTYMKLKKVKVTSNFEVIDWADTLLNWKAHVDNAPTYSGSIHIREIALVDKRHQDITDIGYDDVFT